MFKINLNKLDEMNLDFISYRLLAHYKNNNLKCIFKDYLQFENIFFWIIDNKINNNNKNHEDKKLHDDLNNLIKIDSDLYIKILDYERLVNLLFNLNKYYI